MKGKELIINPYFVIGLLVLLLNDFYLKPVYANFITGKLSDFAGLLIFPMFVATIIPISKKSISLITGIGFILWKLPLFTPVVDLLNQLSYINIHRVIDYSDFIALLILPLSHHLINSYESRLILKVEKISVFSKYALLGISFFAFCATSSYQRYYETPQGTIYIGESYIIKRPKDSVINSIRNLGYNCEYHDEFVCVRGSHSNDVIEIQKQGYYQTDYIIRYWDEANINDVTLRDTIVNIKYDLEEIEPNKIKLTIINVTLPGDGKIQDWKRLKSLSKQYHEWLENHLIEKIKK